jgi:transposase
MNTHDLPLTKLEQRQQASRERRLERYQTVMSLHDEGMKIRAIARELGMGRATVRRYVKAGGFPEMAKRRKRSSILDPYVPYLERRWAEGCHNGLQLYREIRKQGYSGSRPWSAVGQRRFASESQSRQKAMKCSSNQRAG